MDAKTIITISISVVALTVALYGIFERRSETRKATRLRISELVDELNKVTLEQAEPRDNNDAYIKAGWHDAVNDRREIICSIVESLLETLPKGVTEREYAIMAYSLARLGDYQGSRRYWQLARDTARKGTIYECYVLRGQAQAEMAIGEDIEFGRSLYREALTLTSGTLDFNLVHTQQTYLRWATSEARCGAGQATIDALLDGARKAISQIKSESHRKSAQHLYAVQTESLRKGALSPIEEGLTWS